MPEQSSEEFNKKEIGARIKRLRKEAGLRQWQLAEMFGATQPAIHMYERGVLPEPRRLLEIARIGNTTVEWILTGRHWKDGSEEMQRASGEAFHLAHALKGLTAEDRQMLGEAMDIIGSAVEAIQNGGKTDVEGLTVEEIARQLRGFSEGSRRALTSALQIHQAVSKAVLAEAADRLKRSSVPGEGRSSSRAGADDAASLARRKGIATIASGSLEPLRGHIFRLDGSMLVLNDILRDRELRAEFAEMVARIHGKLESKKGRVVKMKKAGRSK